MTGFSYYKSIKPPNQNPANITVLLHKGAMPRQTAIERCAQKAKWPGESHFHHLSSPDWILGENSSL